jgi:hypothetical protein
MTLIREKFINLKQGSMTVVEYLDKFNTLSHYAPEYTDTKAKKKHYFLNGLHVEMQSILVAVPYPDLEALVDAAIMVEEKRKMVFENRKPKLLQQQGGSSSSRSRSLPPPRPAPQPQRPHHLHLAPPTRTTTVSLLSHVLEEATQTPATTPIPTLKQVDATPAASQDTSLVSAPTKGMLHHAPMRQDQTKAKLALQLGRKLLQRSPSMLLGVI